jgi:hypothetical protein
MAHHRQTGHLQAGLQRHENGSKITHPARANIATQGKAFSNGHTQQVLGRELLNAVPKTHSRL